MSKEKRTIKDWAKDDRPREKMMNKGKAAMSDAELLAILLRVGKEGASALTVAQNLLAKANNSLVDLSNLTLEELTEVDGIGLCHCRALLDRNDGRGDLAEPRVGQADHRYILHCRMRTQEVLDLHRI